MNIKSFKFVVINKIPTSRTEADRLSLETSTEFGRKGWELVSVTPIPESVGLLLSFQKTPE